MSQFQSSYARLGIGFLWAAVAVAVLELLFNSLRGAFDPVNGVIDLLVVLIWLFLTSKVAAGHAWARIVYLIITILIVTFQILVTAVMLQIPGMPAAVGLVTLLMVWLPAVLEVLGLLLLFSETTSGGKIGLVFVSALVLVGGITALLVPTVVSTLNKDPTFSSMRAAMKIRQEHKFPEMIDEDTEAFDVRVQKGRLVYYYRLVKVNANGFDAPEFLDRMKPTVAERFCGPEGQELLKQGIAVSASYVDRSNVPIGSLDVNPGDCEPATAKEPAHHEVWKKYVPQPGAPGDAQPETPWRSSTAAATPTPTRRAQTIVETPEMKAQALVDAGNRELGQRNYDAAIKDFQAALALQPDNYAARSGLQEAQRMR